MNYKKIHDSLVDLCRRTSPECRLKMRNLNDKRLLNETTLYIEKHHIIPKHEGGSNDPDNLVVVLPEEHLMLHLLRWKITNKHADLLAVKLMTHSKHTTKSYAYARQKYGEKNKGVNTSHYGKTHSDSTKQILSEFRKGTFYGKCLKTGEKIGMIDRTDPKVLNGEIVHVSKGIMNSNKGTSQKGEINPRWSGYTDEEILQHAVQFYIENEKFWSRKKWFEYCENIDPPLPKHYNQKVRFSNFTGGGTKRFQLALVDFAKKNYNLTIKFTKQKTEEHKRKLSKASSLNIWITNISTGEIKRITAEKYNEHDPSIWIRKRGL